MDVAARAINSTIVSFTEAKNADRPSVNPLSFLFFKADTPFQALTRSDTVFRTFPLRRLGKNNAPILRRILIRIQENGGNSKK